MQYCQKLPNKIRRQISNLQIQITNIKQLKGLAKSQTTQQCRNNLKQIRRLMDSYLYSIESGQFETKAITHKLQYKELKQVINQSNQKDIGSNELKNKIKNKSQNSQQIIIQKGNKAQKQSEQALINIQRNIGEMDERVDDILTQMDRQIKKLDSTYDKLSDTQTTLKRAERKLKYFAKQIYTDRLMICMIIVIALAIIVIIGLAIAGKTPKSQNLTVK